MLDNWLMRSTPLSPSLPGPFCVRVVVPVRILFMEQIDLSDI